MRTRTFLFFAVVGCGGSPFTTTPPLAATTDSGSATEEVSSRDVAVDSGGSAAEETGSTEGGSSSGGEPLSGSSGSGSSTSSGSSNGACTPGATECASGTEVQACTASGQWGTTTTCGTRQRCTGSAGSAACVCNTDPVCTSASNVCASGSTVANCVQDDSGCFYEASTATCSDQTCVSGACTGVCAPGQTRCDGQTPQACGTNGQWGSGTTCDASTTCVSGTCTGVCGPGQSTCVPANGEVLYCGSDGQFAWTGGTCMCGSNGACI